jgi:GMP synthase (glutamine-hydrolysing)
MVHKGSVVILDFGGQYAHLIARRVRECGAYSEIFPPETPASTLKGAAGIILSGGPQSVYEEGSPQADRRIFDLGVPILGICYGHQWLAQALGGKVQPGSVKEYGRAKVTFLEAAPTLFVKDVPRESVVWMSHGDSVVELPKGFSAIARSPDCTVAAMADSARNIFGVQFHLEVMHTQYGYELLKNFVALCHPLPWSMKSFVEHIGAQIVQEVKDRKVFMLVSGGVDSSVAFTLLNRVLGQNRVFGLLVDTGLMRKSESGLICDAFRTLGMRNLHVEDASDEFFARLHDVYEPEEKRHIIGDTFLDVQRRVSMDMGLRMEDGWMLGQGTIYPDTIETGGTRHADQIKTHHNRVEAVQKLVDAGLVIEPLKELYKDEVRALGEELGLPRELVWRHPFPGPGLAVRILCSVKASTGTVLPIAEIACPHAALPIQSVGVQGDGRTYRSALALFDAERTPKPEHWEYATSIPNRHRDFNRVLFCTSHATPVACAAHRACITRQRANVLREADSIVDEEMRSAGLYDAIWQFPVVLLPIGEHAHGESVVLRPVESHDAMTANAAQLPPKVLRRATERILALPGVEMVFYDLTHKPPATIEWE